MKNFILGLLLSVSIISINQDFDEDALDLFIREYKEKQMLKKSEESMGDFLTKKFKEYYTDEDIKYEDYSEK